RKGGQRAASSPRRSAPAGENEGERQLLSQEVGSRATDLLRTDHRTVSSLFHQRQMNPPSDEKGISLIDQICAELEMHAQIEEELFYPVVKEKVDELVREKISNGIREHQHIKDLITQLRQMTGTDTSFAPTVQQLRESVEHHVQEEEREILPAAEE